MGANHSGEIRREAAAARAEKIVAAELRRLGWKEGQLAARRKGDPAKLAMAARPRSETTLSIKEIEARMHLGTSQSANTRLHEWMKKATKARPTGPRKDRPGK